MRLIYKNTGKIPDQFSGNLQGLQGISVENHPSGYAVVHLSGDIKYYHRYFLKKFIRELLRKREYIFIDINEIRYFHSEGITVFAEIAVEMERSGEKKLVVIVHNKSDMNRYVLDRIELFGFTHWLGFTDSVDGFLEALDSGGSRAPS